MGTIADNPFDRIRSVIENLWGRSGAGADLIGAMRQVLPGMDQVTEAGGGTVRWVILPALCCQAAGGDPHWADELAAAWFMLFTAAHIVDKVEDGDAPDATWAPQGPGVALSAATGLFFTASLAINDLFSHAETRPAAAEVSQDFFGGFMRMSAGQQADLLHREPSLEQYWEIARDKSGAFFQVACRCGARLGGASQEMLEAYSRYGICLGILKQILDDLEDIQPPAEGQGLRSWPDIARSLPVVYALSVFPPEETARLRQVLREGGRDPQAGGEAYRLLEKSGAALYLSMEIERYRSQAVEAARQAGGEAEATRALIAIIEKLGS